MSLYRKCQQRFGTAGAILGVIALILALGGTALAAKSGLSAKQKKEVKTIAKAFAGKPGAAGAPGAQGPAGVAGAKGDAGTNGTNGTDGTSATTTAFAGAKGNCTEGGVEVKSASPTAFLCNGAKGETGFTETLPPGKTETGTWTSSVPPLAEAFTFQVPVSFSIPLAEEGDKAYFFSFQQVGGEEFGIEEGTGKPCFVEAGAPECIDTGCRWQLGTSAKPESKIPDTLCVFEQFGELGFLIEEGHADAFLLAAGSFGEVGFGPAGSYLQIEKRSTATPTPVTANGAWAVTAPTS